MTEVQAPLLVRVAIPHYYGPSEASSGYGSCRSDARVQRAVALSRCLGGVLALERGVDEEILGIAQRQILPAPRPLDPSSQLSGVRVDCHVFVQKDCWLQEVVTAFGQRVTVHEHQLEDPRWLPHAARNFLIQDAGDGDADLSLYLEDDLVIQDRLYVDKLIWFLTRTNHQYGIMPHRYEPTGELGSPRFFVDGPIVQTAFPVHHRPAKAVAFGHFWSGERIEFDIASNPHSGSFVISSDQRQFLLGQDLADEGFVGPLETVATYTVLQYFPVLKPSWPFRDFLLLEHGHPSFLYWRKHLPSSQTF